MLIPALLALSAALLIRSLAAERLDRWNLATPVLMVMCGAAATFAARPEDLVPLLNTQIAQHC